MSPRGAKLTPVAGNHGFKEGARIEGRENWTLSPKVWDPGTATYELCDLKRFT